MLKVVLDLIDRKKAGILYYISENINPANDLFVCTEDKIAKNTGCSRTLVNRFMKELMRENLIKRELSGVYSMDSTLKNLLQNKKL